MAALGFGAVHAPAVAGTSVVLSDSAMAQAGIISKAKAEQIALAAVGSGTVVAATFERGDSILHWSIDIVTARYDYEVWVGTTGKVLRIIQQPH